jgi:CHAT domain-containing protein
MYRFLYKIALIFIFLLTIWWLHAQSNSDPIDKLYEQYDDAISQLDKNPTETRKAIDKLILDLDKQTTTSLLAANLWYDLGVFVYTNYANHKKALACFEKALKIRQKFLEPTHNDLARNYFMLGVNEKYIGNYENAVDYFEKAKSISEAKQNSFMLTNEYFELGEIQDIRGDYDKCLYLYEQAYFFSLKSDRRRAHFFAEYYKRMAGIKLIKSEYEASLIFNKKAIQICQDSSKTELSDRFNANIADCYTNMNISYRSLNKPDSAFFCLQKALVFYKKSETPDFDTRLANVYLEMGNLFLKQNKLSEAKNEHQKAIDILEKNNPHHSYLSGAYAGMGEDFLKEKKPEKALLYFEKALKVVVPTLPTAIKDLTVVTDKCLEAMSGIARSQKAMNQAPKAMTTFRQLDTLMSNLRSSLKEDGSKFSLAEQALPIYEQAIEMALLLKDTLTALDFCERNKAVVLREILQDAHAKKNLKIDPSVLAREKALRERIVYYQKQKFDANDSVRGIWQDSIQRTKNKLETLIKQLEGAEPDYFKQKYASVNSLKIADIQKNLPSDMLLLEFFISEEKMYLFAISRSKVEAYPLVLPTGFKDAIQLFLQNIRNPSPDANTLTHCASTSYAIYSWLLKKPLEDFNTMGQITRLRIVPDGILNYIPFDALIEQPSNDLKRRDVAYVLKKYAVSYIFSNQLLNPKNATKSIGSFWARSHFGGFGIGYQNTPLSKLPFAESEVNQLQFKLGGDAFTHSKGNAQRSVFIEKASNYDILHLSMHGTVDDREPMKSALQFVNEKDSLDPLAVIDVNNLDLSNNDLTVLSACNTGTGVLQKGEGIMSLSRAFAQAGCGSLVMSLWTLQDTYTTEIITHFYDNLKNSQPKDIALANAKRAFLNLDESERRAPNYWASLVVIGSVDPLQSSSTTTFHIVLVSVILLVFGFWFWIKKRGN